MDEQRQDDQLGPTYSCSVSIQIYRKRWTIENGGGRGSGRSVQAARHDDDDDLFLQEKRLKLLLFFNTFFTQVKKIEMIEFV